MTQKETIQKIMDEAIRDYDVIRDLFEKNACDLAIKNKNASVEEYFPTRILYGERDDILIKVKQIFKIKSTSSVFVTFKDNVQISGYNDGYGFGIDIYGEKVAIGTDGTFGFTLPHKEWESQFPFIFAEWKEKDFTRLKELTGW